MYWKTLLHAVQTTMAPNKETCAVYHYLPRQKIEGEKNTRALSSAVSRAVRKSEKR